MCQQRISRNRLQKNAVRTLVKALAQSHVKDMEQKMVELQTMVQTFKHLARNCHGDGRPDCPILNDMTGQ